MQKYRINKETDTSVVAGILLRLSDGPHALLSGPLEVSTKQLVPLLSCGLIFVSYWFAGQVLIFLKQYLGQYENKCSLGRERGLIQAFTPSKQTKNVVIF